MSFHHLLPAPLRTPGSASPMRCDLHLHSSASTGCDAWFTRAVGCPESYADPKDQYDQCKARGMTLVTLTDHDTIAGGLTLIDRPDFFLSEEITTRFPDSGVVMHVLAWNITPAQHDGIQAVRADIYRLVDYLQAERIAHACAHPLLSPSWNLDAPTVEKLVLLFPALELVNGLTDARVGSTLGQVVAGLDADVMARLAARHALPARGATPWRKAVTAGSDDHVHRRAGLTYTAVDGAGSIPEFFDAVMAGAASVHGPSATLAAHALSIASTTYHFMRAAAVEQPGFANPFLDMVDVIAGREAGAAPRAFVRSLVASAAQAELPHGITLDLATSPSDPSDAGDAAILAAFQRVCDGVITRAIDDAVGGIGEANFYKLFGVAGDLAGVATAMAPFLFACDHFGKTAAQVDRIRRGWTATPLAPVTERLALFADGLDHVDGVAVSCARFLDQARRAGKEVLVPDLPSVSTFATPLYSDLELRVPSPIATLDWAWTAGVTHVELATPGPMGLAGLMTAKLLRLPVTATYHTEVPELVATLTDSRWLGNAAGRYLAWFYNQVDRVFALSSASRARLIALGVDADRVELRPVAVDPAVFSPARRRADVFAVAELPVGDRPVVLSVGRLSREKNLPTVIAAVATLQHLTPPPVLVIVGDGPERTALVQACAGLDYVLFAGNHAEPTLTGLYASARLFVFASRLDTIGLVTLEAMASGLPVVVPADANITEFVVDGHSGVHYQPDPASLADAIAGLLRDPHRADALAHNARHAMVELWRTSAFDGVWRAMVRAA